MKPWLIITDLDGTMLGDSAALDKLAVWLKARQRKTRILLAYTSGRSYGSIVKSIRTTSLPEPIAIIGNVGTEIRYYPTGELLSDWPRVEPFRWSASRVQSALASVPSLNLQPEEFQSSYKVSYYLHGARQHDLMQIHTLLANSALSVEIVYSSQRDLDVLPRGVNKGSAANRVAQLWNISTERIIACGDSGNDAAMFEHQFCGIVVANALPELKKLVGPRVFVATRPHAAGILEGLYHWLGVSEF